MVESDGQSGQHRPNGKKADKRIAAKPLPFVVTASVRTVRSHLCRSVCDDLYIN